MFPQLPAERRFSVFRLLLTMLRRSLVIRAMARSRVVLMELLGAVRPFEFMAFTRNTGKSDGQHEQRK